MESEKAVTTAVVVMPPQDLVAGVLEDFRRANDKAFARWPPHINLLFPFVPEIHLDRAAERAAGALAAVAPFEVTLEQFGHFTHSRSSTLFVEPSTSVRPPPPPPLESPLPR